jgi:hypothetical protein
MALVPFPGPHSGAYPVAHEEEDDDAPGAKMSFLEHLDELRKRIVASAIAIGVGILLSFTFISRIYNFIMAPTMRLLPEGSQLIYTEPGEAFSLYLQLSLIMGVILAAPVIMYQVGCSSRRASTRTRRDSRFVRLLDLWVYRRAVQPLHHVPVDDVVRELQHPGPQVHAEIDAVFSLLEISHRDGRRVSNADHH